MSLFFGAGQSKNDSSSAKKVQLCRTFYSFPCCFYLLSINLMLKNVWYSVSLLRNRMLVFLVAFTILV